MEVPRRPRRPLQPVALPQLADAHDAGARKPFSKPVHQGVQQNEDVAAGQPPLLPAGAPSGRVYGERLRPWFRAVIAGGLGLSTDRRLGTDDVIRVEDDLLRQLQERVELCRILVESAQRSAQFTLSVAANVLGYFVRPMDQDHHRLLSLDRTHGASARRPARHPRRRSPTGRRCP